MRLTRAKESELSALALVAPSVRASQATGKSIAGRLRSSGDAIGPLVGAAMFGVYAKLRAGARAELPEDARASLQADLDYSMEALRRLLGSESVPIRPARAILIQADASDSGAGVVLAVPGRSRLVQEAWRLGEPHEDASSSSTERELLGVLCGLATAESAGLTTRVRIWAAPRASPREPPRGLGVTGTSTGEARARTTGSESAMLGRRHAQEQARRRADQGIAAAAAASRASRTRKTHSESLAAYLAFCDELGYEDGETMDDTVMSRVLAHKVAARKAKGLKPITGASLAQWQSNVVSAMRKENEAGSGTWTIATTTDCRNPGSSYVANYKAAFLKTATTTDALARQAAKAVEAQASASRLLSWRDLRRARLVAETRAELAVVDVMCVGRATLLRPGEMLRLRTDLETGIKGDDEEGQAFLTLIAPRRKRGRAKAPPPCVVYTDNRDDDPQGAVDPLACWTRLKASLSAHAEEARSSASSPPAVGDLVLQVPGRARLDLGTEEVADAALALDAFNAVLKRLGTRAGLPFPLLAYTALGAPRRARRSPRRPEPAGRLVDARALDHVLHADVSAQHRSGAPTRVARARRLRQDDRRSDLPHPHRGATSTPGNERGHARARGAEAAGGDDNSDERGSRPQAWRSKLARSPTGTPQAKRRLR